MAKSLKPRRRRSIDILGHKIKIKYRKYLECDEGEEMDGLFDFRNLTIFINSDRPNISATLLHECTHAALMLSGVSNLFNRDVEEAIVEAIESGLKDFFYF